MTNERAREVLQEQIDRYGQEYDAEGIEALEMAIRALGSWEKFSDKVWKRAYARGCNDVLDKIREEIKQAAFNDVHGSKYIFINRVDQIIDKYKAESEDKE